MSDNLDRRSRFAWLIVSLLFAGSVVNYMDRSLVSVILPQVRRDLAMTNADFGLALNFFLVMYAVFYIREAGSRTAWDIAALSRLPWPFGRSPDGARVGAGTA